jgi:transposase-like protein
VCLHKPVVEIGKDKRPRWRCLRCGETWPLTTGRREEGKGR